MTTYLAGSAVRLLDQAQRVLDQHMALLPGGACRFCRTAACRARDQAQAVFARYRQLPRRRPGASIGGGRHRAGVV